MAADAKQNRLAVGVVVLVVALAIGVWQYQKHNSNSTSCKLDAAGVGLVAEGLSRGEGAREIVVSIGLSVAAETACESIVDTWKSNPDEQQSFTLERNDGSTTNVGATGIELTSPAPATSTLELGIRCIGSVNMFFYNLCVKGLWPPPPR